MLDIIVIIMNYEWVPWGSFSCSEEANQIHHKREELLRFHSANRERSYDASLETDGKKSESAWVCLFFLMYRWWEVGTNSLFRSFSYNGQRGCTQRTCVRPRSFYLLEKIFNWSLCWCCRVKGGGCRKQSRAVSLSDSICKKKESWRPRGSSALYIKFFWLRVWTMQTSATPIITQQHLTAAEGQEISTHVAVRRRLSLLLFTSLLSPTLTHSLSLLMAVSLYLSLSPSMPVSTSLCLSVSDSPASTLTAGHVSQPRSVSLSLWLSGQKMSRHQKVQTGASLCSTQCGNPVNDTLTVLNMGFKAWMLKEYLTKSGPVWPQSLSRKSTRNKTHQQTERVCT